MNGLLRYNAIQKALSSYRKETGKKFIAGFHKTASQIYRGTKEKSLEDVIKDFGKYFKGIIPEIPDVFFEPNPFFNYDIDSPNRNGMVTPDFFPPDVKVKSPQLKGKDWLGSVEDLDYDIIFKDFTDYINANKDIVWKGTDDAPRFYFTPLDFDYVENCYYTELRIDRDDAYGYQPGIGATINEGVPASEPREKETKEELKEAPKPSISPEIEMKRLEAEKLRSEKEIKKLEIKKQKEINKTIASLESMLKRKLITKKDFKKYVEKLMSS